MLILIFFIQIPGYWYFHIFFLLLQYVMMVAYDVTPSHKTTQWIGEDWVSMRFTIKGLKHLAVARDNWQIQTICRKNSQPAQIPRMTYGYNKSQRQL